MDRNLSYRIRRYLKEEMHFWSNFSLSKLSGNGFAFFLPIHWVVPVPVNPLLQEQMKAPFVLMQVELLGQGFELGIEHSSISTEKLCINRITSIWQKSAYYCRGLITCAIHSISSKSIHAWAVEGRLSISTIRVNMTSV